MGWHIFLRCHCLWGLSPCFPGKLLHALCAVLRCSEGFPRQAFLKLNWDYRIAYLRAQLQSKTNSVLSLMLLILTFTLKWYKLFYQSLPAEPVAMYLSGT